MNTATQDFFSFWKHFHRDASHRLLGGVCAGMANSLGWQRRSVRALWIVAVIVLSKLEDFTGLELAGLVPLSYLVLWIAVESLPAGQTAPRAPVKAQTPAQAAADRLRALDARLAQMEAVATSEEFRLRQEIEKLR